ncbi:HECTD1 protein [Fasciola gigantica]|uniref:E3 ubiquitin-protein ligase n=1 Tax=Fasciola gigantica TaxID=46835 RepID=A0A504Y6Q0_FASGI|nr:HECTD1 protein [Fasciola gigantica]
MEADPKIVLEWLGAKNGELRALQLTALEQLCNEVLFSDNIDAFCERYSPRCFLPALCRIFLDDQTPPDVLEANARAVSYYIEMHLDWCKYITQSDEVLRALGSHLGCVDMTSPKSNEFGQQLIKLMKVMCNYDPAALYTNGGLTAVLQFVRENLSLLHTDVLQAGMELIRKLFSKADPSDTNLKSWIEALSAMLEYRETGVADQTLRAFANLVARFAHSGADPSPLAHPHIIACLLHRLRVAGGVEKTAQISELSAFGMPDAGVSLDAGETQAARENATTSAESNPAVVQAVTNILITLCCSSGSLTQSLLTSDGQFATTLAMVLQRSEDETVVLSVLRLVNILLVLLYQKSDARSSEDSHLLFAQDTKSASTVTLQSDSCATVHEGLSPTLVSRSCDTVATERALPRHTDISIPKLSGLVLAEQPNIPPHTSAPSSPTPHTPSDRDLLHRSVIEAIKNQDFDTLKNQIDAGQIDVNYTDHLGQTLLNWAASFGTPAIVDFLCSRGANINQGVRSPLDYAATFGRVEVCRTLLTHGADPNQRDDQGRRPIDRAREQVLYPGCQQVIDLLESETRRSTGRVTSKPTKPQISECSGQSDQPPSETPNTEAQHIFVHQLFPTLVALFRDSVSTNVKRQCLLLVRRMVAFIHPSQLEEISMLDCQNLPFAFSLAQLIYGVLVEETDEFILRALVLSHCLLVKAPRIYVGVFHRLGLSPMIHQLADIWSHLIPTELSASPNEKIEISIGVLEGHEQRTGPVSTMVEQAGDSDAVDSVTAPNLPITAEQLQSNQLYSWRDWKMIWVRDLLSMFTPSSFVIVLLHPTDGGLRALAVHGGGHQDRIPVMLTPGEPAVPRPGLKSHMLRLHQHLMEASEHLDQNPLWSDVRTSHDTSSGQNRSQSRTVLGADSHSNPRLPPRSSHGKFEANKANWRRVGLHLGLRRPPESTYIPKNPSSRSNSKAVLQRQASSPARSCILQGRLPLGTYDKPTALGKPTNVVTIGPLVCSLRETTKGSRLCIQARALPEATENRSENNSSFKEALLFFEHLEQGFCRVRISSVYPEGSTTEVSEVNVTDSGEALVDSWKTTETKTPASCSSPTTNLQFGRRRHSASLLTLLSKVDSELQSDGEQSSTESSEYNVEAPELFDFDALFGLDSESVTDQSGTVTGATGGPLVLSKSRVLPEVKKELRRINEILFPRELVYETYTSGYINTWLCVDDDCIATENRDRQERAFKQLTDIRKQALKLSKGLLTILSENDNHVTDPTTTDTTLRGPGTLHCELRAVRAIATEIWTVHRADQSGDCAHTMDRLSTIFKRLADLLRSGEQAMTAYELTISGLVPALLLCLSATHAGQWTCPAHPIGPDKISTLLWYLRERRRVFLQQMSPHTGLTALGCLSRRVVRAFELSEHLPLRLFALSHYFSPPSPTTDPISSETDRLALCVSSSTHSSQSNAQPTRHCSVASLPLGLIRAAGAGRAGATGESRSPIEAQQFADCLDVTELRALFTFCPYMACRSDEDYVIPGMHQIDMRITMDLIKLTKVDNKKSTGDQSDELPELRDWSNQTVHVNPLVTAAQLERFLLRMSVKQWYNKPRTELTYWNQVARAIDSGGITFSLPVNGISSIDSVGGVIDWLATDGNTRPIEEWVNPALIGLVTVAASVNNLVMGTAASILGPRSGTLVGGYPVRCSGFGGVTRPARLSEVGVGTSGPVGLRSSYGKSKFALHPGKPSGSGPDEVRAWFAVDLGLQLIPTAYSMAYLREAENFNVSVAPKNWNLEASNDGIHWTVLREHVNDTSIHPLSGSRAAWSLVMDCDEVSAGAKQNGYRFFKIQSTGTNSSGSCELAIGGLEFYGTVCATHESVFSPGHLAQLINRESVPITLRRTISRPAASLEAQASSPSSTRGHGYSSSKDEAVTSKGRPTGTQNIELSIGSVDTNLLQYLGGLISSDQSTEGIRQLLRQIRTQDSTDDESLPQFTWPKKRSPGTSSVCEPSDTAGQDQSPVVREVHEIKEHDIGDLSSVPSTKCTRTTVAELSIEPQPPQKLSLGDDIANKFASTTVDNSSSSATASTLASIEPIQRHHLDHHPHHDRGLRLFDQSTGDGASESQHLNVSEPYGMNPEDAEALEFADTVEAIIESNISSSDSPFPRGLPPSIPDRFVRLASTAAQPDVNTTAAAFRLDDSKKKQTTLSCWFIENREHPDEAEEDIASDPEYALDFHLSNRQRRSRKPETAVVESVRKLTGDSPFDEREEEASKDQSSNKTTVTQVSHYVPIVLRQGSSPASVNLSSKLTKPSSSEDPYKSTIFSTSKASRQLRRRLRRPRPRGSIISSPGSNTNVDGTHSSNQSASRRQPLSWHEAVDYLRLPPGLIPVFDPNPGCTNAPATTPFVLCNPPPGDGSSHRMPNRTKPTADEPRIALFLSAFDGDSCIAQVPMLKPDTTLFRYIHELYGKITVNRPNANPKPGNTKEGVTDGTELTPSQNPSRKDLTLKLAYRLWDPSDEVHPDAFTSPASFGLLSSADLRLTPAMQYPIEYTKSGIKVTMMNEVADYLSGPLTSTIKSPDTELSAQPTAPEQFLHLLTLLYQLSGLADHSSNTGLAGDLITLDAAPWSTSDSKIATPVTSTPSRIGGKPHTPELTRKGSLHSSGAITMPVQSDDFVSGRLTRKLLRQIRDPLALSSGALPDWCFGLSRHLAPLFSFDSRLELLRAHAFGPARSVIWLQNQPPVKQSGPSNFPLSRSHSDGSSNSSGTTRARQSAVTTAHTLVLSSLTGQQDSSQMLSPSTASDVLLLRPSILSHLTTSSAHHGGDGGATAGHLDQPSHLDNPVLGSLLSSLGLTLPPGLSLRSGNCPQDLSELWNCLLSRTARAHNGGGIQGENRTATHVGRLHKEFVRLPRMPRELVGTNEQQTQHVSDKSNSVSTFWDWAACLMEEHASRKSELEIQFIGEDGTGLGPTLEFYSLLAAELRRRDGLMWVVDDISSSADDSIEDGSRPALPTVASKATIGNSSQSRLDQTDQSAVSSLIKLDSGDQDEEREEESFDLTVEANSYVNTAHGLFPAAWPQDRIPEQVLHRFYILGITVAKCLQDNRRIDLPFSPPLLKLLSCYGKTSRLQSSNQNPISNADPENFSAISHVESVLTSIYVPSCTVSATLFPAVTSPCAADAASDLGEFLLSPKYRLLHDAVSVSDDGATKSSHWLSNLLGLEDFELIYPERARFLRQAVQFCRRKYDLGLKSNPPHTPDPSALNALACEVFGCTMEDICLSMEFLPTSEMFTGASIRLADTYDWEVSHDVTKSRASPKFDLPDDPNPLKAYGEPGLATAVVEAELVTVHNMEQYVFRTLTYCLDKGIRKQMDAFRAGFERVFPLDWLALFNGHELGQLIAGDTVAQWSRDDLLAYTVPCFGFTHQSPTYQMLINVLCGFNALERRAFLQFTTGCSSLPPGGLKNLHPRLRVVRKDAGTGALPSVNTCVHYLKLPEYQTEMELRSVLLRATREIGFYLN